MLFECSFPSLSLSLDLVFSLTLLVFYSLLMVLQISLVSKGDLWLDLRRWIVCAVLCWKGAYERNFWLMWLQRMILLSQLLFVMVISWFYWDILMIYIAYFPLYLCIKCSYKSGHFLQSLVFREWRIRHWSFELWPACL